jgi:hypothetical protein
LIDIHPYLALSLHDLHGVGEVAVNLH